MDKAKDVNSRNLIHNLVHTISFLRNDQKGYQIGTLDKESLITYYEYFYEDPRDVENLYDVGLNLKSQLLIIVNYKDRYTVYNYHLNEYRFFRSEADVASLIVKEIPEPALGTLVDVIIRLDPIVELKLAMLPMGKQSFYLYTYQDDFIYEIYFDQAMIEEAIQKLDPLLSRAEAFDLLSTTITENTVSIIRSSSSNLRDLKLMVYRGPNQDLSNDTMYEFVTHDMFGSFDHQYNFILRVN